MSAPVIVFKVQGEAATQGLFDCLRNVRRNHAESRGSWHVLRSRMTWDDAKRLADDLRIRYSMSCCRCTECASQVRTRRDCMGHLP